MFHPIGFLGLLFIMGTDCKLFLGWGKTILLVILIVVLGFKSLLSFYFFSISYAVFCLKNSHTKIYLPKATVDAKKLWRDIHKENRNERYKQFSSDHRYLYQGFNPVDMLYIYKEKVSRVDQDLQDSLAELFGVENTTCTICRERPRINEEWFNWRTCKHLTHWDCFAKNSTTSY